MTKRGNAGANVKNNELHFGHYEEEILNNRTMKNSNFILNETILADESNKV